MPQRGGARHSNRAEVDESTSLGIRQTPQYYGNLKYAGQQRTRHLLPVKPARVLCRGDGGAISGCVRYGDARTENGSTSKLVHSRVCSGLRNSS